MKRILSSVAVLAAMACYAPLFSQVLKYDVPWSIWLHDEATNKALANANVDATISYKDSTGTTIYSEGHGGVTDLYGHYTFKAGSGTSFFGSLKAPDYYNITRFGYDLTVNYQGEDKFVSGEQEVLASGKSNASLFANDANNASRLGGYRFNPEALNFGPIVCPAPQDPYQYYSMFSRRDPNGLLPDEMVTSPLANLIRMKQAQHVVTLQQIAFLSFGLGLGKPIFCGPDPQTIYGLHGITMPNLAGLTYGVDLRVQNDGSPAGTGTLNCENANAGGYGIRALGATGAIGYGNVGHTGVTYGSNSGIGGYFVVQDPPLDGTGFKYGVCGNANGKDFSYAAALVGGPSFTTDPIITMSDGRLKKNVTRITASIDQVNQLRPATYEFIEDSTYHFSKGIHHGFVAQELAIVFPELVGDIILPKDMDFNSLSSREGILYKGINYEGLIPVLTASIQELDAKVVNLEIQLAAMQKVVQDLTQQVSDLAAHK